jgi:putative ABC transport system permease protein
MRNIKLAFRTLFRTPFVTIVAILSLALGIGANAAIYSLFNQLLLKPLPVADPARLVNIDAPGPQIGSNSCNQQGGCSEILSYPMFRDLEKAPTAFSGMAGHRLIGANVAMKGQTPLSGDVMLVSGGYFSLLGVRPTLGRLFTVNDDITLGGHPLAVLNYAYWETQLGSDPSVLNKQITVNGQQLTIIGVGPRGFNGTTVGARPFAYVPLSMRAALTPGFGKGMERRNSYWVYVFARLKPNATIDGAQGAVNTVYNALVNERDVPLLKGISAATMAKFRAKKLKLTDGRRGQSQTQKQAKTPLILLFTITGIVLLIACANIANLLLARAANRSMEMAVRLSIGAVRSQLIAQLLTESVVLALLGGVVSMIVAKWTLAGVSALLPSEAVMTMDLHLSGAAVLFTAVISLGTGILFGVVPALQSTRPDLVTELRNNSGKLSGGRGAARFRTGLVTAQIALSMALLISAGLFIKSLLNVSRVALGVNIDNMVTFGVSPELSGYDTTRSKALFGRVEEELRTTPGIAGVTASFVQILAGNNWGQSVSVEGFKKDPDTDDNSRFNGVGAGFFKTLNVPMIAGREFTASDVAGAPRVAVVNETFAKKFHLGRNAVGKHMSIGNDSLNVEIVGLVKDSKYSEVKDTIPPVYVLPYAQVGGVGSIGFYVRSTLPTEQVLKAIRTVMKKLDPSLPIEGLKTMPQQVKENVFLDRMISTMSAAFALLATLLAAVGLYGVLAYSVAQRTREIGVRMALGADAGNVRRMVLKQVAMMAGIGGMIGIAAAIGLGRAASSLLYELKGYDPAVFAIAIVSLTGVAFCAGLLPALKASRVDPMQALRYE